MTRANAIGIDIGTTCCCVGVLRDGKVEIIANEHGNRTTPSYVAFTDTEILIGDDAKNQVGRNAGNTVFGVFRLIGRKFEDAIVQADMRHWPFKVISAADGRPKIQVEYKGETKIFYPEQIIAMIISKMKKIAENYLGEAVRDVVVTVPAYFNDSQRQATKDAAAIAGVNVLRIVNKSSAAAMAYGLDRKFAREHNILVFDLGGGALNVSILTIEDAVFEVKSTAGDTHFGGEDFTNLMVNHFVAEFKRNHNKDLASNPRALSRLRDACECAKRTLSSSTQARIEIDALFEGIDYNTYYTRARFEELCADLFRNTMEPVEKALRDAKMDKDKIHEIVLVGGSSRIPKVQKLLSEFFSGKELNKSINLDEAGAQGAAIEAAILSGDQSENVRTTLLIDVNPFSFGIETAGGVMTPVIKRNSSIPTTFSRVFSTATKDDSSFVTIVYEGERAMVKDNNLLGNFGLTGIAPAPGGVPQITVTFDVDANGILTVTAQDKTSGKKSGITITNGTNRLSRAQINRMIQEAERYAEEGSARRDRVAARSSLEFYCLNVKWVIDNNRFVNRISENDRKRVLGRCNEELLWLEGNQAAEKYEFEEHLLRVNLVCNPIMMQCH